MGRSYRNGLRLALVHWRVVALVFVVSLTGACVFMAAAWAWLAAALDSSLATRTLSTSLDVDVFVDLVRHHGDSLRLLALVAVLLGIGASLVWIGVNGIVLAMVGGRREALADAGRAGLEKYPAFFKLWLAAMTAHAAIAGGAYFVGRLLIERATAAASELTELAIVAAIAVVAACLLLIIATIHDHARIRCLETGDAAGRCGLWACGYIVCEWRAVALTLLLVGTTAAGWGLYQSSGRFVAADSGLGLTLSLVWAQLFMLFRALIRVWGFAAATDLQSRWESS